MPDRTDIAESYRDLSKILATIGSGLFVAAGIGATFFSSSINTTLSMVNQQFDLALKNNTELIQSNTTALLQEGASQSLQAANASIQLMFFLFGQGVLISGLSVYFWHESHRVLKGEKIEVSLKWPFLFFILGSIGIYISSRAI
ncbi:MAG: hypothetical protein ABEI78_01260 [Candidatus Nanohaloarchaea archaeon]